MRALLLLLVLPGLASCGSMQVSNETLICILACVHSKTDAKKIGPQDAGRLNTKSTQDFSDPEKDQAPQADGKK